MSFAVGFAMETFMVHTGFYSIVTKKVDCDRKFYACFVHSTHVFVPQYAAHVVIHFSLPKFINLLQQEAERRLEAMVVLPTLSS
jgi:hypothetical protein